MYSGITTGNNNLLREGGIGKTSLLKNLYTTAEKILPRTRPEKISNIFISLDAYDYANPVNIMMGIRNGIREDCGLFDYALLQYCAKAKLSPEDIIDRHHFLSSPVMDVLNEVISLGTASAMIPTAILKKCVGLVQDAQIKKNIKKR